LTMRKTSLRSPNQSFDPNAREGSRMRKALRAKKLEAILPKTQGFDCFGEAFFNELCTLGGDAAQVRWRRSGRTHQHECDHRETQTCDASRNEHVVHVEDIEAEDFEGDVVERLDVIENREGKKEKEDGQRGKDSQGHIEAAVEFLAGAAMRAFDKVLFVVFAHLRINPRDVIAPACQNGAYNSVGTIGSCHREKTHFAKDVFSRHVLRGSRGNGGFQPLT